MNKKVLVGLGIVSGILLIGGVTYADDLKEALELYLQDPSLDWLGRNYDKILFENIQKVSTGNLNDAEFFAKLKFIIEDIKTMPLQLKCMKKIVTQRENAIAYGGLTWLGGLKMSIGEKAFNKIMGDILKLVFK